MPALFTDRKEAGDSLARALAPYKGREDVVLLALPRGGIQVAVPVARDLLMSFDLLIVKKLGAPWDSELALGAVASGSVVALNEEMIRGLGVSRPDLERVIEQKKKEVEQRNLLYRGNRPPPNLEGKTVILIDDGMATGADMRAAAIAVRASGAGHIVVAVPVASRESIDAVQPLVDAVVALSVPEPLFSVGAYYGNFEQVLDEEVLDIMSAA